MINNVVNIYGNMVFLARVTSGQSRVQNGDVRVTRIIRLIFLCLNSFLKPINAVFCLIMCDFVILMAHITFNRKTASTARFEK